jgi:hypothetical protein
MKTKITALSVLFLFIVTTAFPQEKSKKEIKDEQKLEKQMAVEAMVTAREFTFVGRMANPSGMRSVNLATNPNFMKFSPGMVESEMPYFGTSRTPVYGGDAGLKFKGEPEEFTLERGKKNYEGMVIVKGEDDKYKIYLTIGFDGNATLSVSSNNRSNISYTGQISGMEITPR